MDMTMNSAELRDSAQLAAAEVLCDPSRPSVYLWGAPGRGKTWIVDRYLHTVRRGVRWHFHEFLTSLHSAIGRHGGVGPALDAMLDGYDVVCFDEFHVHDPADARYIEALLRRVPSKVQVVVTSNYPPAGLLPNPLFHHMIEATVALIGNRFAVIECDGGRDYRRSGDARRGAWLSPGSDQQLQRLHLCVPSAVEAGTVTPCGHRIEVQACRDDEVWFRFDDLCAAPTAPADYLALAAVCRTWVITEVPPLRTVDPEVAQRFANVIDVLFDQRVAVVITSAVAADQLCSDADVRDGDRLRSRLAQLSAVL